MTQVKSGLASGHHVDFIMALPLEIVYIILIYFETMELFTFLDVSEAWKKRLYSFDRLWSRATINGTKSDKSTVQKLDSISNTMTELRLIRLGTRGKQTKHIFSYIKKNAHRFPSVKYLEISSCSLPRQPDYLLNAISDVACNLKHLKLLDLSTQPNPIYFDDVLRTCKQLEHFWCDLNCVEFLPSSAFLSPNSSASSATPHTLKQLVINGKLTQKKTLSDAAFEGIASICPNIRYLSIPKCSSEMVRSIARYYGHQLKHLIFNVPSAEYKLNDPHSNASPKFIPMLNYYNINHPESEQNVDGLCYLEIDIAYLGGIDNLLKTYANRLEGLNIPRQYDDLLSLETASKSSISLTNLRVLKLDGTFYPPTPSDYFNNIAPKIALPTSLQVLRLCGLWKLSNYPLVIQSIKQMQHLTCLHMERWISVDYNDLVDILDQFTEKQRHLKSIWISSHRYNKPSIMDDHLLQKLGNIHTLEEIKITNDTYYEAQQGIKKVNTPFTEQGISNFCSMLQNTHLRTLNIDGGDICINTSALEHLASIPTLKFLHLNKLFIDVEKRTIFKEQALRLFPPERVNTEFVYHYEHLGPLFGTN